MPRLSTAAYFSQFQITDNETEKDPNKVDKLITEIDLKHTNVVTFPETWTSSYDFENIRPINDY